MLNRFPNEILVKVLGKTETATAKNCRLLNNRFNLIIKRFELHNEKSSKLSIYKHSNVVFIGKHLNATKRFETMDEFLANFQNIVNHIRTITVLSIASISITIELLDILLNSDCMRKLLGLHGHICAFAPDVERQWLCYSECLRLNEFDIIDTALIVSPKIFTVDLFPLRFEYQLRLVDIAADLSWLDDTLLHNWFLRGKVLKLWRCKTGLTIVGILKFLEENADEIQENDTFEFGILKEHRARVFEAALIAAQAIYTAYIFEPLKTYEVRRIRDKKITASFSHRIPVIQEENE